jgi:hypothetical protein
LDVATCVNVFRSGYILGMLVAFVAFVLTSTLGGPSAGQIPQIPAIPLIRYNSVMALATCKPSPTCREILGPRLPAPAHFAGLAGTFPKCPAKLPKGVVCQRFIAVHRDWVAAGVRIHPKGEVPESR